MNEIVLCMYAPGTPLYTFTQFQFSREAEDGFAKPQDPTNLQRKHQKKNLKGNIARKFTKEIQQGNYYKIDKENTIYQNLQRKCHVAFRFLNISYFN